MEENDDDDNILFQEHSDDGNDVVVPCSVCTAFFKAEFHCESYAPIPKFGFDLSVLGKGEAKLQPDVWCTFSGLDTHAASQYVETLLTLDGVALNVANFLQNDTVSLRLRTVPPAALLCRLFGQAEALQVRVRLDQAFLSRQEIVCSYFDCMCEHLAVRATDYLPLFNATEVLPRVIHLQTSSRLVLASAFVRLQEHYEGQSTQFRRQSFSLDAFRSWYRQRSQGDVPGAEGWCFYLQWPGFNVPSWVLQDCYQGMEGGLRPVELALLQAVSAAAQQGGWGAASGVPESGEESDQGRGEDEVWLPLEPFYVIGTCEEDRDSQIEDQGVAAKSVGAALEKEAAEAAEEDGTLRHEMAHGLFATDSEYHAAVQAEVGRLGSQVRERVRSRLLELGYCSDEEIVEDETQAYMVAGEVFDDELRGEENVEEVLQAVRAIWRGAVQRGKRALTGIT